MCDTDCMANVDILFVLVLAGTEFIFFMTRTPNATSSRSLDTFRDGNSTTSLGSAILGSAIFNNPFHEETPLRVQPDSSLAQLEVISCCPVSVALCLREETNPHLATTSFQVVAESDKAVSLDPDGIPLPNAICTLGMRDSGSRAVPVPPLIPGHCSYGLWTVKDVKQWTQGHSGVVDGAEPGVLDTTILDSVPRLQVTSPAAMINISAEMFNRRRAHIDGKVYRVNRVIGQHRSASDLSTTVVIDMQVFYVHGCPPNRSIGPAPQQDKYTPNLWKLNHVFYNHQQEHPGII
ncbi:hypothetical protein WISP_07706 [Willisornis vidua]|uniref:Uncharacterized protein n=1 Tax=Willisornis vidua TaxID=1566151 RepID=A0ABQ9DVG6_9PASS|nr:hypothetical protein WISP_07706 [Willisornis vidua]